MKVVAVFLLLQLTAVLSYRPCSDFIERLESPSPKELLGSIKVDLNKTDVRSFTTWTLDVTFIEIVNFNMKRVEMRLKTGPAMSMEDVIEKNVQTTDNKTFVLTFKTRDVTNPTWSLVSVTVYFLVKFPGRWIDVSAIAFNNHNVCTEREVCGELPDSEFLIHKGETVRHGEWPWLAAIHQKTSPISFNFLCAGTLVSSRHVITAAHCIRQRNSFCELVDNEDVVVGLGVHKLLDFSSSRMQLIKVQDTLVHPEWGASSNSGNDGDIAILLLSRSAHFSDYVRPACVNFKFQVESVGSIVGWGLTETGEFFTVPRAVSLPTVSNQVCRDSDTRFIPITSDRTFCAGRKDGAGPCKGDSGGGFYTLMTLPADRPRYSVSGVVSRSLTNPDFVGVCDLYQYAIFTRLGSFKEWIQDLGGFRRNYILKEKTMSLVQKEIDAEQNTAISIFNKGNVSAAYILFNKILDDRRCVLGEDHSDTLNTHSWAAYTAKELKDFEESLRIHDELIAKEIRISGPDKPHGTLHNKAEILGELGRYKEALELYDKVIEIRKRLLGENHEWTRVSINNREAIRKKLQAL